MLPNQQLRKEKHVDWQRSLQAGLLFAHWPKYTAAQLDADAVLDGRARGCRAGSPRLVPFGVTYVTPVITPSAAMLGKAPGFRLHAAAEAPDADHPHASLIVSAVKVRINRGGRFVGESAIQLHGGIDMPGGLPVGH